ncbi:STAS domain-containing protein [Nonomuraea sp. MG754425]|uniref:STAS domain-containing protein n=1 Tax=Nonomuraea sp. MG754425 TaxID=2570319 RepID=UPI001F36A8B2|nr:STAS domain-containing protein [Nonomuraea sp. MG754425]MCF6470356.1 STAS domain-containing protein [Nonomuraea sp. MG754425]
MILDTFDQLRVTLVPHPFGLRITGEIDCGNRRLLADALGWALLAGSRQLRLDLSGLVFLDVAGLRLIVGTAARLSAGREVVLDPISPMVRRLLAVTGWDRAPGLRVPSRA